MVKFWWRSGSRIRIQIQIHIRIATLVRRALAEVCTVPELLVECEFVNFSVSDFSELRQGAWHRVGAKNADVGPICGLPISCV